MYLNFQAPLPDMLFLAHSFLNFGFHSCFHPTKKFGHQNLNTLTKNNSGNTAAAVLEVLTSVYMLVQNFKSLLSDTN